jgi:hypothetical protein
MANHINTNNVFQDFDSGEIGSVVATEESVYGWILPDMRANPDTLSDFGLQPLPFTQGDPVPQLQRPTQYYFYKVYDNTPTIGESDEGQFTQFTVTYGNRNGDGVPSAAPSDLMQQSPTEAIYEQYVGSALPEEDDQFFPSSSTAEFYAVNLNRTVQRSRIRPGAWQLKLGYDDGTNSGEINVIDASVDDPTLADTQTKRQEIEVVPGTLSAGTLPTGNISNPSQKTYGYVYPDKGIIVLNPEVLAEDASNLSADLSGEIDPVDSPSTDPNHKLLFDAIDQGALFRMQAIDTVVEKTFSTTVRQEEFNYSLNPTYSDSNGSITFPGGGAYFTTVGLYNDDYELVAVAKLANPQRKEDRDSASIDITVEF